MNNMFAEFKKALENSEFESSDVKLKLLKQMEYSNNELVKLFELAMEFSYEKGLNDCEDFDDE